MTLIDAPTSAPVPAAPLVPARPGAGAPLAVVTARPAPAADRHPAAVYLARLTAGSRPTMHRALDTIASIISGGRDDAATLEWAALRYQHTQAVRAVPAERYAPANANKHLSALRGVLKECWRLGLMAAEEHQRAADLETVRGSTLLRGRALSSGEMGGLLGTCAWSSRSMMACGTTRARGTGATPSAAHSVMCGPAAAPRR